MIIVIPVPLELLKNRYIIKFYGYIETNEI